MERDTRTAILELSRRGQSTRGIAQALGVSRVTVRKVLESGEVERPDMERGSQLDDKLERVRELHLVCKGNLVRVHEELGAEDVHVAYTTLTAFCRRHRIGVVEKVPAGRYHFAPGAEMQHDTSPHDVEIGGRTRRLQCASLVLAHSRMIFAQLYPTFAWFYAKTFLTEALRYFGGAAATCMVDNTHVIVAHGTGKTMVPAPEMAAFAARFGFAFVAHAVGDVNRSARVERPFDYIERNFYPGRTFTDLHDANVQFRAWCERGNARHRTKLHAAPVDLFCPVSRVLPDPSLDWLPVRQGCDQSSDRVLVRGAGASKREASAGRSGEKSLGRHRSVRSPRRMSYSSRWSGIASWPLWTGSTHTPSASAGTTRS